MNYVYLGQADEPPFECRETEVDHDYAARRIGERVLVGFEVTQRAFRSPSDDLVEIAYFRSSVVGNVWALYYE